MALIAVAVFPLSALPPAENYSNNLKMSKGCRKID
jgi:hypothetical protein